MGRGRKVNGWKFAAGLLLSSVLGIAALAQTAATPNLPLVTVGSSQNWDILADTFRITVPQSNAGKPVDLQIYSPSLNPNDYRPGNVRSADYYGDELYSGAAFSTKVRLRAGANTTNIFERIYGFSSSHDLERVYNDSLAPGVYKLSVSSTGNGKSSYALSAAPNVAVQADQFTINAHGTPDQEMLAVQIPISSDQLGKTLKIFNYDGDTNRELELTLVLPNNQRRTLKTSSGRGWARNDFVVGVKGRWTLLVRIPVTARQFSNAFRLRFVLGDKPFFVPLTGFQVPAKTKIIQPITVSVVDSAGVKLAGASYRISSDAQGSRFVAPVLPAGYIPNKAVVLSGEAKVISSVNVKVGNGGANLKFVAGRLEGGLAVETVARIGNEVVPLPGLNVTINNKPLTTPGILALPPGTYKVEPPTLPGSSVQAVQTIVVGGKQTKVVIEYVVVANLSLKASQSTLEPGQSTTLTAIASTAFPYPVPVTLKLQLPDFLETDTPTDIGAEISAKQPAVIVMPANAVMVGRGEALATLEPFGLNAKAKLEASTPAALEFKKTANQSLLEPGNAVSFQLEVTNTGGRTAEGIVLTDVLPKGLSGENFRQQFSLSANQTRVFTVNATVVADANGKLENVATVIWNGQTLKARASVIIRGKAAVVPAPNPTVKPEPISTPVQTSASTPASNTCVQPNR
jgi:uncharacterized repeat protein (TIGR01451 family)